MTAEQVEQLAGFIARKGGSVTPRRLVHANARRYPCVRVAREALDTLTAAGLAEWSCPNRGRRGRPSMTLVLIGCTTAPNENRQPQQNTANQRDPWTLAASDFPGW